MLKHSSVTSSLTCVSFRTRRKANERTQSHASAFPKQLGHRALETHLLFESELKVHSRAAVCSQQPQSLTWHCACHLLLALHFDNHPGHGKRQAVQQGSSPGYFSKHFTELLSPVAASFSHCPLHITVVL